LHLTHTWKQINKALTAHGIAPAVLDTDIASKWERHGDLLLFSAGLFEDGRFERVRVELLHVVAACLHCTRIATKTHISTDDFRTPQVRLLYGQGTIVRHIDNGVHYEFDIRKNMFAAGNIREKLRVSKFKCAGETIVDLYAGIGYFALQYLVHTGAARLYACEWNPAAVAMLERNLVLNHVQDRCVVRPGDNALGAPRGVADRVNMGLIPSCERGWPVVRACACTDLYMYMYMYIHICV
jgi:tRNA wybutosine-synthesizing protein 2